MSKTLLPDDFEVTDAMRDWASERFPDLDLNAQTEHFIDYARAKGWRMVDWKATWRNWMRNAYHWGHKSRPQRFLDAR